MFCSEGCATGSTRGWYYDDDEKHGYVKAYDHDVNKTFVSREYVNKFISERPWLLGSYQWTSFDHRGESAWPRLCSQSGAFDMFMQKKDAFYQNLSHWTDDPVVHLLPHWNFQGMERRKTRVVAYTNMPTCELVLSGKSLGVKGVECGGSVEWEVPYKEGVLEAVAYDGNKKAVAFDRRETMGKAERLAFKVEMQGEENNGEKIILLTCHTLDSQGREVPNASPFVRFYMEGDGCIVGTGSGVSDHVPPKSPDRQMFEGKISVGVKMQKDAKFVRIYACSEGLRSAMLELCF